jgi:cytochrome c oxidase assembly protein subunit 11
MSDTEHPNGKRPKAHGRIALALAGLVAVMIGLAFASVPLYRMFCQVTGYGGVPQRADIAPEQPLDQVIKVRFDANVDHALPWTFAPVERAIDVKIGETALAYFKATNRSKTPVTGSAVFNVEPARVARYFTKIQCFCFTKQTLAPGASAEMPVTFFIDPKFVDDEDTKNVHEITLSYTFYRTNEAGIAARSTGDPGS